MSEHFEFNVENTNFQDAIAELDNIIKAESVKLYRRVKIGYDDIKARALECYEALKEYVHPESNDDIGYVNEPAPENKLTVDYFNNINYRFHIITHYLTENDKYSITFYFSLNHIENERGNVYIPVHFTKGLYQDMTHFVDVKMLDFKNNQGGNIETICTVSNTHRFDTGDRATIRFKKIVFELGNVKRSLSKLLDRSTKYYITDGVNKVGYEQ